MLQVLFVSPRSGVGGLGWMCQSQTGLTQICQTALFISKAALLIHPEKYQSYCDRLRQDMYFLTSNGRLSEHLVDKVILQLNRVYPQILTNKEAEKFRNPKALLHIRLSDLISHLQKKGDKHCQEFYRALQINAEQLYNDLPSRKTLSPDLTAVVTCLQEGSHVLPCLL
ncbi:caspase recruitment domain-containing protein 19 isoform X6 [Pelodiscus sinensis]|uniref:caspase recruitment domain-containing protein 19 isoform X6 n=1 Tax=Pelodiscus sinensis TaxID=13735 RepID=UPI003F6D012A